MIQGDVKSIGILGKFLANNPGARNGLEADMDFVIHMQKKLEQMNTTIRKGWLNWLSWTCVDFAIHMQRNIGQRKSIIGKSWLNWLS
jgi:hypothetical protein